MKRILLLLLVFCLLLGGCSLPVKEEEKQYTATFLDLFDTVTTIIGFAESQEEFDRISGEVLAELGEYHRLFTIYHRFEGLENLCTINNDLQNGEHRTVKVDEKVIDMLSYAKEMHTLTGGMTNIAMGSVLSIWHDYRTAGIDNPSKAELPPMELLKEAALHTDINNLIIDEENSTVYIADPKMTLDVGAVAKGYAVEMVARYLQEMGKTILSLL